MLNSKTIIHLYDETYFLGGISKFNNQKIGCGGWEEFKNDKIHQDKINIIKCLDFKDKNVLDIGFGRGEILKYCYENGARSCVGIDYSPAAFKIASEYLKNTNVKLYCLAADEIIKVKENDFEVIYMGDILEHVSNNEWEECFKTLKYKLNINCALSARTPAVRRGDYLQMHNNYHSMESLMGLFEKIFKIVTISNKKNTYIIYCKEVGCGLRDDSSKILLQQP